MALTNKHYLLFYVLLFAVYQNGAYVHGRGGKESNNYYVVDVSSLEPKSSCSDSTSDSMAGSQKLKVTYRYGPCSPSGKGKEIPGSEQILVQDKARVESLNNRISNLYPSKESSQAGIIDSNDPKGAGNYVVTIKLGTPKRDYTVIIDTGSDITWVQCKPCSSINSCYPQTDPLFDPSKSTTYINGPCKSGGSNAYTIPYHDGTYSMGHWGCDTITLEPSDEFTNFQFGCGQNNGPAVGKNNSPGFGDTAGILGLGPGERSLVSQTASKYGKIFGYYLPTKSSTGCLLFGAQAKSSFTSLKFTPLIKSFKYYFLKLIAISVGGKQLNVSPLAFASPGTIIDSGTVITRLPVSAYSALKSVFQKSMSKYPYAPPPPKEILDTCYNLTGYKDVVIPKIMFHFGGGTDVILNPLGVLWTEGSSKRVCLAFAPNDHNNDLTIIGSYQQKGINVVYDIEGGRIGFGTRRGC